MSDVDTSSLDSPEYVPENFVPDDEAPERSLDTIAEDIAPQLHLPDEPKLVRLVLPPRPILTSLPEFDASAEDRAEHAATVARIRQENRQLEKAWEKARNEAAKNVDVENRELRDAWKKICDEEMARYHAEKKAWDLYQSRKLRIKGKIEQAVKDQNKAIEGRQKKALAKLERDQQKARDKADRETRANKRLAVQKQNMLAVVDRKDQLRRAAQAEKDAQQAEKIKEIAAQQAAITAKHGDPFAGLSKDEIKQRHLDAWYFEGTFYVRKNHGYVRQNDTKFEEALEIHCGISTAKDYGAGLSDAKRARHATQTTREVDGVGHFAWMPVGVLPKYITGEDRTVLNLCTHRLGRIAEKASWGGSGGFPQISLALENAFGLRAPGEKDAQRQLDTFLSILARFAQHVAKCKPRISMGIVLVGDAGAAKGWLQQLLRMVFGGVEADPWPYFVSGCRDWNDELAGASIWLTKDPVPVTAAQVATVTAAIKQSLSEQAFTVKTRFISKTVVERYQLWVLSMNRDPKSRSCLPGKEVGDKISTFRVYGDNTNPILSNATFDALKEEPSYMLSEHAAFRRFLLDYQIPDYVKGGSRFGVRPFCHPEFEESTIYQAELSEAGDLIHALAKHDAHSLWRGTATEFIQQLEARGKVPGWDNVKLGKALTKIHDEGRPDLVDRKWSNGTTRYTINLDAYRDTPEPPPSVVKPVEPEPPANPNRPKFAKAASVETLPDSAAAITAKVFKSDPF